jgi:quinol monooxygenase YgiN
MTMELFLFARFHARPGMADAVRRAMREVEGPTRAEPGCLAFGAFQSVRDPDELYVHSRWRDRAAFDLHASLPHTVRFVETVEPLLDHPFHATLAAPLQPDADAVTAAARAM